MDRKSLELKAAAAIELEKRRLKEDTVWGIVCPKKGLLYSITKINGKWVKTDKKPQAYAAKKLELAITSNKRFIILYGGRGSTKSVFAVDLSISEAKDYGSRTYFLREFQSSIKTSVHSLVKSQIKKHKFSDFESLENSIKHNGESVFEFAGIARNTSSVKSTHGFRRFSIEEAQFISNNSLTALTPSLRKDTDVGLPKKFREENSLLNDIESNDMGNVSMLFVANPMSSSDPFSQRFIEPYKRELDKDGFYEDDLHLIIKINYCDNPWFEDSGLEEERMWDYENRSREEYDHIWLGSYNDSVDGSIIKPEWFDACVDAHKIERLKKVFKPHGAIIAAHDPSDTGEDAKGLAIRHGSIIKAVKSKDTGEVDEGCDWATGLAIQYSASWFVWDGDGMGAGLKRQVSTAFNGTAIKYHMFRGSLSGSGQDNAKKVYMPQYGDDEQAKPKTYAETFKNNRAQYYTDLATRCYNTYRCVVKGDYVDPDEMISFDSEGIDSISGLRSEICRIPKKDNPNGLIQIMNKKEMKALGIDSPNEVDSVMMSLFKPVAQTILEPLNYPKMSIV
jgi:phage terminase large subunit